MDGRRRERKKKNQRPAAEEKSSSDDWKLPLMVCMQEPGRGAAASALAPGDALDAAQKMSAGQYPFACGRPSAATEAFVIVSGARGKRCAEAGLRCACELLSTEYLTQPGP